MAGCVQGIGCFDKSKPLSVLFEAEMQQGGMELVSPKSPWSTYRRSGILYPDLQNAKRRRRGHERRR